MRPRLRPILVLASLFPACERSAGETSPFTTSPPMTSAPDGSSGSSTGSPVVASSTTGGELSTSGSGTAGVSTSAASTFDVGTAEDFAGKPIGCKGKIDFLFVISSAGSMANQQKQLIEAFPAFYGTVLAQREWDEWVG